MADDVPQVTPPWTAEQVASLNDFQACGYFHSFACPRLHMQLHPAPLQAFPDGWACPNQAPDGSPCTYRQDWAHQFMADGSWRRHAEALDKAYAQGPPSEQELARWEAERQVLAARIDADPVLRARAEQVVRELDDPGTGDSR